MLLHHHAHGIHNATEHRRRSRLTGHHALFHAQHVGKKDLLFLHEMNSQLFGKRGEGLLNLEEFWMVLPVYADYFGGERLDARALFAYKHVMGTGDVSN